jgi:hypothetical protein
VLSTHIISFEPDSIRALQAVSRALQHVGVPFLTSNARAIARLCSSERSTLCSLINDLFRRHLPNFATQPNGTLNQPNSALIQLHDSVLVSIRSLGLLQDCRSPIFLPEGIRQFSRWYEDSDLSRIWPAIRSLIVRLNPALAGVPAVDASVEDIRNWMHADANQPVVQGIPQLTVDGENRNRPLCMPQEIRLLTRLRRFDIFNSRFILHNQVFNTLAALRTLALPRNHLISIPENLFENLTSLRDLALNNNLLTSLPDGVFRELHALRILNLNNNRLVSLSERTFNGLDRLADLRLARNPLVGLPRGIFDGLNRLQNLNLHDNPTLMISLNNLPEGLYPEDCNLEALGTMRTFYGYASESPLAQLYQLIAGNASLENVQSAFSQLPDCLKNALFGCVWVEAGSPNVGDPQWAEHHAFDDMQILGRALKRYVRESFEALSVDQRNAVYHHVYDLARREPGAENVNFDSPAWGEEHAGEHILRLIDAMMRSLQRQT